MEVYRWRQFENTGCRVGTLPCGEGIGIAMRWSGTVRGVLPGTATEGTGVAGGPVARLRRFTFKQIRPPPVADLCFSRMRTLT